MLNELLLLWSQRPAISLAVWLVLLVTVLYLAREPAHQLLKSTGRAIYRFMRSAARAVAHLEQRALQRADVRVHLLHARLCDDFPAHTK